MIRRLSRTNYKIFAMDIESHNDEESLAKRETSMWLGCFIDETSEKNDPRSYFYSMDEFIDRLEEESSPYPRRNANEARKCKNVCVYIFNLSFEWSFILPCLLERGFEFRESFSDGDEFVYNSVSTKSVSSVWQVSLRFGKKNGKVIIRDLSKIFSGSLASVAKAFDLPTQKGEIDYRLNRLHGHIITNKERFYCFDDTRIIVDILMKMQELDDRDFWNAISAASYSMRKMIRMGYPRSYRPYREFRKDYPELGQEETDFLRRSVSGGITYAVSQWQFKDIHDDIGHIDLHQAHPSSLYNHLFPKGEGEYFRGKPVLGKICCCRIRIGYDFVRLHSVIQLIGIEMIDGYELVVWDFEIPTMKKCYGNLRIEYIDGYAYKMGPLPWRKYYLSNYEKRKEAKRNKDAFFTMYYKLLNNSSYGKLLERPHDRVFANIVRDDGVIDSIVEEAKDIRVNAKYTYLPVGSCCPAYTRVTLVEAALRLGWENVLYFDTDSIFFLRNEKSLAGMQTLDFEDHLGGWGYEETLTRAQFTAPKRYKTQDDGGKVTIKAGGINFNEYIQRVHRESVQELLDAGMSLREAVGYVSLDYEEVNITTSSWKVQRAFRCKGGTLIDFQVKEMKIPPKYLDIYERNADNIDTGS